MLSLKLLGQNVGAGSAAQEQVLVVAGPLLEVQHDRVGDDLRERHDPDAARGFRRP
jgi:hypothetical protein